MSESGFISRAACQGRRPSQFSSITAYERPQLVARLMQQRSVARFIIAPSGYGKTFLAIEYAETVCSWSHVFWINCQSPCFIRDLDEGNLVASLLSCDQDIALAVFDDLPPFNAGRQEAFSRVIDELLAKGCEIVVTCLPTCDTLASLQLDRLCLRASELLLSDSELDALRSSDERARQPVEQVGLAYRVPVLVWLSDLSSYPDSDSYHALRFVKGMLREELPSDLLLIMCSMLILGEGTITDLVSLEMRQDLLCDEVFNVYPHFGFSADTERFEAPSIEVGVLASSLKRVLPQLVQRSSCDLARDLVSKWASVLLQVGHPTRACSVIKTMYPRRNRAEWIVRNGKELIRRACFFPVAYLASNKDGVPSEVRVRLEALQALSLRILGDNEGAIQCAKRCAFAATAPEDASVLGLLIIARIGEGFVAGRARKELRRRAKTVEAQSIRSCSNGSLLARAWCVGVKSLGSLSCFWMELFRADVAEDVLCVCASWMFALHRGADEQVSSETASALKEAELFIKERLKECETTELTDFFAISAGLSIEEAHLRGMELESGSFDAETLILLRQTEMDILNQRHLFNENVRLETVRRDDWVATHPASLLNRETVSSLAASKRTVPVLMLRLFGGFEVSIGDTPIEYSLFKRQNTRALLVMLAVHQGREVARDAASAALWPNSSNTVARKNFYTVWSDLRHALSLPDGTCPYLIRHRYGCSLDFRFVQSDVDRFNEICRELLFGVPNIEHWALLFAEIDRDFPSDLMPSECKNTIIMKARDDYRARLVDSLVAATMGAIKTENPQWGVWFARAAIERDETREDAYVALMQAQIAGNQRTAAMMTYLHCRRALAEYLGIDPAPETTALYESLLGGK